MKVEIIKGGKYYVSCRNLLDLKIGESLELLEKEALEMIKLGYAKLPGKSEAPKKAPKIEPKKEVKPRESKKPKKEKKVKE